MLKLILTLLLVAITLIAVMLLCQYCMNKIENIHQTKAPQLTPLQMRQLRYQAVHTDYEAFASGVWQCLNSVQKKCGLKYQYNVDRIYCTEVADRVDQKKGKWVFRYEFEREEITATISNGQMNAKKVDFGQFADIVVKEFEDNLQSYLDARYTFSGPVFVTPLSGNLVRIEIYGVMPVPVCGIQI